MIIFAMRNGRKVPLGRINYVLSKLAFIRMTIDWNITVHLFHELISVDLIRTIPEKIAQLIYFHHFASTILNILITYSFLIF